MKTCFIGHRLLFVKDIRERIEVAVMVEMALGCTHFIMGTHGDFDGWALAACSHLRQTYKNLDIEVVVTGLSVLKKSNDECKDNYYDSYKTVMYDIEEAHFKQRITLSNRKMIDECDTLICYVDEDAYHSGAKTALRYAQKRGLKIVNLYRDEDNPLYGLSEEEKEKLFCALRNDIVGKK